MTITTKYNIGRTVWVNENGGPSGYSILCIHIEKQPRRKPVIIYELGWDQLELESDLFPSYRAAKAASK